MAGNWLREEERSPVGPGRRNGQTDFILSKMGRCKNRAANEPDDSGVSTILRFTAAAATAQLGDLRTTLNPSLAIRQS
jgi:hypothetical protein